ncbi:protein SPMIP2 [Zootoca vivipara]|uniref:protein SPMIP2 n=1 Tax=Zootoca vivipara TaxID=8524 RepID=UPI00293B872E|nr:protein SPMIP2 [Zootoca vivipara]
MQSIDQPAKGKEKTRALTSSTPLYSGNRMIFTGPDGLRNHRSRLPETTLYIGAATAPEEGTSEAGYLWRPAPRNPPPWYHRSCYVGEIGWGVGEFHSLAQKNSQQLMHERFPPAEEFEIIARYRNPSLSMYPAPDPEYLGWADDPNYPPPMMTLDGSETSPHQMEVGLVTGFFSYHIGSSTSSKELLVSVSIEDSPCLKDFWQIVVALNTRNPI